jgi:hypothetical protein
MTTLCKTYPSEVEAHRAVDALRAAGVPERDIELLARHRMHDVRREPVGTFAGTLAPDAPVATFGDVTLRRDQGSGTYAGDADRQRQGCFADTDSDLIVSCERDHARERMAGDATLLALLRSRHVAAGEARRIVDALHGGHAAVLAEIAEIAPSEAKERLEKAGQAA